MNVFLFYHYYYISILHFTFCLKFQWIVNYSLEPLTRDRWWKHLHWIFIFQLHFYISLSVPPSIWFMIAQFFFSFNILFFFSSLFACFCFNLKTRERDEEIEKIKQHAKMSNFANYRKLLFKWELKDVCLCINFKYFFNDSIKYRFSFIW